MSSNIVMSYLCVHLYKQKYKCVCVCVCECVLYIDIESLQNRLLKVCYVPVTNASLPRVSFFFSFLFFVVAAIDSTNEANKVPLSSLYS